MMTRRQLVGCAAIVATAVSTAPMTSASPRSLRAPTVLWAWERPEDLRSIDPTHIGVAYLARTVTIATSGVSVAPRFQPLLLPPSAPVIAVVRLDTRIDEALLTGVIRRRVTRAIVAAWHPGVSGIQIDFDARRSERAFYRDLLGDVRATLPSTARLSITALASWCFDDRWMNGLPVDEAVPMLFRMGPDASSVRARLTAGDDFREPLCRHSVGVSTDEATARVPQDRTRYIFSPRQWSRAAVIAAIERESDR